VKVERNFLRFMLYVAYFPQLVAGPIERAKTLLGEMAEKLPRPRPIEPAEAVFQIAYGLFKKMAVADSIGPLVQPVFANPEQYGALELIGAACFFSIQIYCDFSGYTDIAIGISRLFGIRLMRNFRYPYFSASITEFWRRWHISLSTWLRDYLYISLGGNRAGAYRTYANLLITMLLGGLWHGPSWNFVLWGLLHGLLLALHRVWTGWFPESPVPFWRRLLFAPIVFVMVSLIWIPFVSTELGHTFTAFSRILAWESGGQSAIGAETVALCVFLASVVFIFDSLEAWAEKVHETPDLGEGGATALRLYRLLVRPWLPGSMVLLTIIFASPENQQFIYFQF
jgi:D-alanyl-lipoteichoic acid acyltransferase DltB (MBOAT superfamily)